ncbi:MAG: hypothetical protein ABWZ88_14800, partial [Variovorax sp.]
MAGFGRALRRAGVRTDAARIALAAEAAMLVGVDSRTDLAAAMEAVMVSREQDRLVFRELFDAWFQDPELANKMLAQMLPSAEGKAPPVKRRPRVREALAAPRAETKAAKSEREIEFDAAMTASDRQRMQHADFNALGAAEYRLVERLARDIALPVPTIPARRLRVAPNGGGAHARMHWPGVLHQAARTGGELVRLPRLERRQQPLEQRRGLADPVRDELALPGRVAREQGQRRDLRRVGLRRGNRMLVACGE